MFAVEFRSLWCTSVYFLSYMYLKVTFCCMNHFYLSRAKPSPLLCTLAVVWHLVAEHDLLGFFHDEAEPMELQ